MRRTLSGTPFRALLLSGVLACGGQQSSAPATASSSSPKRTSVLSTLATASPKKDAAPPWRKEPPRTDPSLIQRHLLFANPDRALPLLSPDGKRLSYLSNVDGVLNVWVAPTSEPNAAKAITKD